MKKDLKKYIPWIVLLLVILSLSVWYLLSKRVTQEQTDLYNNKMSEAQQYVEARQYSVAMEKYYEAVDIVPRRLDAYEGLIGILILKNRTKDAIDVIEKSAKPLSSQDKSVLYNIVGDKYFADSDYLKAFDLYDEGLVLGVNNMSLELSLGKVFLKLGDINQAKGKLEKTGYKGKAKAEANLILSYIYSIEDEKKALQTLELVDSSEYMTAYYEEFTGVLKSLDEDAKFNATKLARVYINNGYPYLAIKVLEPIKDEIGEYLEGMYFLGRAYFEYGDYEKAIQFLDGALTLGGMETDILWTKARAYFLQNDLDNTTKSYDSAIGYAGAEISKDLVDEYINILLDNNQALKANLLIRDLVTKYPELPYLYILAVKTHNVLKEDVKVEFYLSELEELELEDSERIEYLELKIQFLLSKDEEIDKYLVELENLDRFSPYYQLYLAQSQIKLEENELATQSLERAIEYDLEYEITEKASKLLSSLR